MSVLTYVRVPPPKWTENEVKVRGVLHGAWSFHSVIQKGGLAKTGQYIAQDDLHPPHAFFDQKEEDEGEMNKLNLRYVLWEHSTQCNWIKTWKMYFLFQCLSYVLVGVCSIVYILLLKA